MSITAGTLLGKASKILLDESNVRWPITTEMIGWLDSAQREVVLLKPALMVSVAARKLSAGTRQTLPAGTLGLAEITRNMGLDGLVPGKAIVLKSRQIFDVAFPDWHSSTASAVVTCYFYEPKNPKEYFVWPPQPAANQGYVEEVRNIAPTLIADANANIGLDDIYEGVLLNLVLSRAYGKDGDNQNMELSKSYRAMAMETLGLRAAIETESAPKE